MKIEEVARFAHEINRAYCIGMGDNSQPSWDDAPDWQRESAIAGVCSHIDNPDLTPEQSHELWLKHKVADGWVYGSEKDPVAKTHPCIQLYHALPRAQRVKDYLFSAVVRECAAYLTRARAAATIIDKQMHPAGTGAGVEPSETAEPPATPSPHEVMPNAPTGQASEEQQSQPGPTPAAPVEA